MASSRERSAARTSQARTTAAARTARRGTAARRGGASAPRRAVRRGAARRGAARRPHARATSLAAQVEHTGRARRGDGAQPLRGARHPQWDQHFVLRHRARRRRLLDLIQLGLQPRRRHRRVPAPDLVHAPGSAAASPRRPATPLPARPLLRPHRLLAASPSSLRLTGPPPPPGPRADDPEAEDRGFNFKYTTYSTDIEQGIQFRYLRQAYGAPSPRTPGASGAGAPARPTPRLRAPRLQARPTPPPPLCPRPQACASSSSRRAGGEDSTGRRSSSSSAPQRRCSASPPSSSTSSRCTSCLKRRCTTAPSTGTSSRRRSTPSSSKRRLRRRLLRGPPARAEVGTARRTGPLRLQ